MIKISNVDFSQYSMYVSMYSVLLYQTSQYYSVLKGIFISKCSWTGFSIWFVFINRKHIETDSFLKSLLYISVSDFPFYILRSKVKMIIFEVTERGENDFRKYSTLLCNCKCNKKIICLWHFSGAKEMQSATRRGLTSLEMSLSDKKLSCTNQVAMVGVQLNTLSFLGPPG